MSVDDALLDGYRAVLRLVTVVVRFGAAVAGEITQRWAGRSTGMGSLCSCLCIQSGHAGCCQEIAVSGLYLPAGEPRIRPVGVVCGPCYEAALGRHGDAGAVPSQARPEGRLVGSVAD